MRYPTIVVDPPWQFDAWSGATLPTRTSDSQYDIMNDNHLATIDVKQVAAPDCALFMWATMPKLPEAIALGQAWGFTYKTVAFTWVKLTPGAVGVWFTHPMSPDIWHTGMGYWTRANAELVLLFTRGAPKRIHRDVKQVVAAPVTQHSKKPEEVQNRIERLVTGPYLELFARRQRPGWTCLGNEIDGLDIRDALTQCAASPESDNVL